MGDLIQLKRGLSTSWATKNLVLQAGEPGYETDTGKMKIGDGTTTWNDLDYSSGDTPLILDAPPTTSTVSPVGRIAIWHDANATDQTHANHLYHMAYITTSESTTLYHWEECVLESARNVAGGFAGLDVNGLVPADRLPLISTSQRGVARYGEAFGIGLVQGDILRTIPASNANINNGNNYVVITPSNLKYAVRSVLPNVTEIPSATSDYSLVDSSATTNNHSMTYRHSPQTASIYRLPSVSNDNLDHNIIIDVKFSTAVLTYEFKDSSGNTVVPLPLNGYIVNGTIVRFLCTYSIFKAQWVIMPVVLNPEVA